MSVGRCFFNFSTALVLVFATLVSLFTKAGRPNHIPSAELTVICFVLWTILIVVAIIRGLWEYAVVKRNFAQAPFDQLNEIGFLMQQKAKKELWHWTSLQFFRYINGFPVVAHVDCEWAPKSIKFSAQVNHIQFEKSKLNAIAETFQRSNIEFGIREISKLYPYRRHQLNSIETLDEELLEFTDQLKKYGFTGNTSGGHNTIYTQ